MLTFVKLFIYTAIFLFLKRYYIYTIKKGYDYGCITSTRTRTKLSIWPVWPKVTPATTVEPTTGISIPTQHSYVDDGNGNKISMGQDGVGLAHRDAKDYGFMLVA